MKTNIVIGISPPAPYLAELWSSSYGPKCCQPIKLQDSLKCNISRKKWMMKRIFGMQINIEVFYKLIISIWVYVTRLAQSTQNKFAYLCNISRRAWGWLLNEIDFLRADKHENFLQNDSFALVLPRHGQITQNNKFPIYQGKTWRVKLIFCLQINVKNFFKLILSF